ncbi:T9SS type A sorting domain-containing protein [Thermophagus sp. OGC60D27]|uniref:T9SS type A sorting domain-containing protein n=1 Tax=Thermophagus sp. OGC60D27 TaxID=3458415 RepID=UPI0040379AF4
MKKFYLILLGLIITLQVVDAKKQQNSYISYNNYTGDFESDDSWNGDMPSADGNVDKEMFINGTITRNGDLNPVDVVVNGSFIVTGNYTNNQWGGLTLKKGAYVEIFGDLTGSAGISVAKDATLIVHGNLSSTGSSLQVNGDLIVLGDFSTSSSTQVQNNGNLIVGGDFSHLGGGLKGKEDDIYILDPNAEISGPGWGVTFEEAYGTLDDFIEDEGDSDLYDLVVDLGVLSDGPRWVGNQSSDWYDEDNWENNEIPDETTLVIIDVADHYPVIEDDLIVKELKVLNEASITISEGASLEVTDDVNNAGTIILQSTNDNLASLMLPETMKQSGIVKVKLSLESNSLFYLSSPIKSSQLRWFYPDGDIDNDFAYVFRDVQDNDKWQWYRVDDDYISENEELETAEAVFVKYVNGKELSLQGEVNNDEVTLSNLTEGYYLLGNPFPTAIDWEDPEGWDRDGISNTIWSWISYNGMRIVQTYNNGGDFLPGIPAIIPPGYDWDNVSHIAANQAFQIKVEESDVSLTIKRSARVKNSSAPLKSASAESSSDMELIRIQVTNDFAFDGTVLYFHETLSEEKGDEDADKKFNSSKNVPEVYTRIDEEALSINGLSQLVADTLSFPFSVRNNVEGQVTLEVNLEQFNADYDVFLEDKETGVLININDSNQYVYTPVQLGDDHDRFVLHLEKVQKVATAVEEIEEDNDWDGIHIIGQKEYALLQISPDLLINADATIQVLDLNGHLVSAYQTANTETQVDLPAQSGIYLLRVAAGGLVKTQKVAR